jgi:hypothetical protein
VAFARPASGRDEVAAEQALRRLVEADEATALAARPPAPPPSTVETMTSVSAGDAQGPDEQAPAHALPKSRRALVSLVVIIGLALGLGGGIAAGRAAPNLFATYSTPEPRPSGTLITAFAPQAESVTQASGDLAAAAHALDAAQSATDVLPVQAQAARLGIVPTTVHRVLTTADGVTLWIARTPSNICLLETGDSGQFGGAANCVPPRQFTQSGVTVQGENELWSWNGASFTVAGTN